jgi:hypothetical protein
MGEKQEKVFKEIRKALTNTPALGFPDVMKPFFLYVHERLGTAVGILTQLLGPWHCPVPYLSKQLDAVSRGWLLSLCALVATAVLVAEADTYFGTRTHSPSSSPCFEVWTRNSGITRRCMGP